MKRRLFSLLLALLTLSALVLPASADIIWEPEDSFYNKHREECNYVNRSYELAGYGGTVTLFTAPGGSNKATLDNGLRGGVQFTWEGDGITWGYLSWVDGRSVEGWVPMDDLSLIYDSWEFQVDHASEISDTGPVPVDFQEAVLYSYPNGPSWEGTLKEDAGYQPFSEVFTSLYTDENGLRWGYVGYYMGHREAWVCLDDPMNTELNTGVVPAAPSPAQVRGSATVTAGPPVMLMAGGLVAAVVIVTGILIWKLKKRDRA